MIKLGKILSEIRMISGLKNSIKYPINKILHLAFRNEYNEEGEVMVMVGWGGKDMDADDNLKLLIDILVNEYKLGTPQEVEDFVTTLDGSTDITNGDEENNERYINLLNHLYDRYNTITVINLIQDFMKFKQGK